MQQALYVTSLGMALVFLALLVVMGVALVSERLFRARPRQEADAPEPQVDQNALEEEARVAAVIAASLAILDQEAEVEALASLPESVLTLERVPRGWKAAGRFAGMR